MFEVLVAQNSFKVNSKFAELPALLATLYTCTGSICFSAHDPDASPVPAPNLCLISFNNCIAILVVNVDFIVRDVHCQLVPAVGLSCIPLLMGNFWLKSPSTLLLSKRCLSPFLWLMSSLFRSTTGRWFRQEDRFQHQQCVQCRFMQSCTARQLSHEMDRTGHVGLRKQADAHMSSCAGSFAYWSCPLQCNSCQSKPLPVVACLMEHQCTACNDTFICSLRLP